jgi:3-hydroxyacyl-[acyl-carrier-protein] dehydratase
VKSWEADNDVVIKASTRSNSGVTCQAEITLSVRERLTTKESWIEYNEFDRNDDIFMGPEKIMEYIPHRYPFLLVDYIKHIENGKIMGVKNVSFNEPVFRGYMPEYSVLPGSIQCEIFAQVGCVYQLSLPENKSKIAYFMSISEAEFFAPIVPGDQLVCDIKLPTSSSKFGRGEGTVSVDGKIVSKITMAFALVDA